MRIPCGRGSVFLWRRCDTGAESDVYECLVAALFFWRNDKIATTVAGLLQGPAFIPAIFQR